MLDYENNEITYNMTARLITRQTPNYGIKRLYFISNTNVGTDSRSLNGATTWLFWGTFFLFVFHFLTVVYVLFLLFVLWRGFRCSVKLVVKRNN